MKILIIGNGFDIAHGLPTRYKQFLLYTQEYLDYYSRGTSNEISNIVRYFNEALVASNLKNDYYKLIERNVWYHYFLIKQSELGDGWIDCESEICSIISNFEQKYMSNPIRQIVVIKKDIQLHSFVEAFKSSIKEMCDGFIESSAMAQFSDDALSMFIEFIFQQLRDFTRAFEIYCICIVNRKTKEFAENNGLRGKQYRINELICKQGVITTDINKEKNGLIGQCESLLPLKYLKVNHVLSFNYTSTYEELYGNQGTTYCYIHGEAQQDSDTTSLIFGIDDPLENTVEASKLLFFSKFKKYFQRIYYKTGSQYKDWIRKISDYDGQTHEIYIVGHSLGATDCDVLREFFNLYGSDFVKRNIRVLITIFYYDEKSKIETIQRVIEIIGKENLIERVHGEDWTIRFVDQYDIEHDGVIKKHEETEFGKY